MAITGKFLADFASFEAAVQKADVSLKGFEGNANKVATSLTRMSNSLSGQKMIADATLMAAAVEKIGGVSKLTEKELQRLSAQAKEAVEKMQRLGIGVPANLQAIADAGKGTTSMFSGLAGQITATAAGFVTAQAIIGTFKTAISALGRELVTLTVHGAAVADVSENFERLTAQAGQLGSALLGTLRAGTHATIDDFELMKTVNQDLAAGMDLTEQQFGTLAKGAFALAQATGTDVKSALDTMNDAMLTGRTRALALLTGKIDLAAAETKFAASIGTTADKLSEEGKLEAARVGILDAVTAATARLGEQTDGLDERIDQARVAWTNFENELGKTIATSAVLEAGMAGLKDALIEAFGGSQETAIKAISEAVDTAAIALVDLAKIGVRSAGFLVTEYYAVQKVFGNLAQAIDIAAFAANRFAATTSFGKLSEGYAAEAAKLEKAIGARAASLQAADAAQASVNVTTANHIRILDALQAKMITARTAQAAFVGPINQTATALTAAGAATARHGELTKLTTAEIGKANRETEKAVEIQKRFTDAIENATVHLRLSVFTLNRWGAVELPRVESALAGVRDQLEGWIAPLQDATGEIEQLQRAGRLTAAAFVDLNKQIGQLPNVISSLEGVDLEIDEEIQKASDELEDLSKAFAQLAQISGDAWGGMAQDIGQVISAMNLAQKSMQQFKDASNWAEKAAAAAGAAAGVWSAAGQGTNKAASIGGGAAAGAAAGVPYAAVTGGLSVVVGAGVGALIGWYRSEKAARQVNDVRDAFIAQAGGLEILNQRAKEVNLTLEALLSADSAKELTAAMDGLGAALSRVEAIKSAASKYGPTKDEIAEAAALAEDVYEHMLELQQQGQVTQEQVYASWIDYMKAIAAAGDTTAAAWLKANEGVVDGAKAADDAMSKLQARRDELAKGVANEAPEEVMGVIESQMRAQMAALDAEIAAANQAQTAAAGQAADETAAEFKGSTDDWTKYAQDRSDEVNRHLHASAATTASDTAVEFKGSSDEWAKYAEDRSDAAARHIQDAFGFTIHIPIAFDVPDFPGVPTIPAIPQAHGGDYLVTKPTLFLAGEAGSERATFTPMGGRSASSSDGPITVQVVLDGHIVAENTVSRMAQDKRGIGTKARRVLGMS